MTENEEKFWLDGDEGITPYLRLKDNGMPQGKINQIAWLLLSGSGCGFCKVCRDEPCNIKDGEKCTINIANYIRKIVLEESENEIQQYRSIGTVEECREAMERQRAKKPKHRGCYDNKGVWREWNGINGKPYELCPNCETNLCCEMPYDRKPEHCDKCGQKLDWSDNP